MGQRHAPAVQVSPGLHARPHPPQFAASFWRFAQYRAVPPEAVQVMRPTAHVTLHDPAEQTWPEGQALPQRPQFALSDWKFTHAAAPPSVVQ